MGVRWFGIRFAWCWLAVLSGLVFICCSSSQKKSLSLDDEIRRELSFHIDDHEACFAAFQKRRPNIYGDLTLKWTISENGETSRIVVREDLSNLHDLEFRKCMIESLKNTKFPLRPQQPIVVEAFPFRFRK